MRSKKQPHQDQHRLRGMAAAIHNPKAAVLARAINQGGDANMQLKDAVIDAQIHHDWNGVTAIENSLLDVRNRTIARNIQNIGTRANIVLRSDQNALSALLPDGFEYGLAWLVTLIFIRTDGDYATAMDIGDDFHELVTNQDGLGMYWGNQAMCLPMHGFGPSSRHIVTNNLASGNSYPLESAQNQGFQFYNAQERASVSYRPSPLAYLIWGCHVTGVEDLSQLFDESIWCPGMDVESVGKQLTSILATASSKHEGDTFIHPKILPANIAHEMAQWEAREHTIAEVVEEILGEETTDSYARVSILEASQLPYLDQILVMFFNKANMMLQTFRFPRSGKELEEDANMVGRILKDHGIGKIEFIKPKKLRGANDVQHLAIDQEGNWVSADAIFLGNAGQIVKTLSWPDLDDCDKAPPGSHTLPSVLFVHQCGVGSAIGDHYTTKMLDAIKNSLSGPGDPGDIVEKAMKSVWQGDTETISWLLDHRWHQMIPPREIALALQFKLASGSVAVATEGLLQLLSQTDIGDECPVELLQSGFEVMYLHTKTPALALDEPEIDDGRCFIDGIMVQRWQESDVHHLLLDVFLTKGTQSIDEAYPLEAVPFHLIWSTGDTLADLRKQIEIDDGLGQQVLNLYSGVSLYMNSRDARLVQRNEHSEAAAKIGELGRKKRKKSDYELLNGSFDAVHVGPESSITGDLQPGLDGVNSGKGKKPHYRRGFVRMKQRVGKGRKDIRPVFVSPTFINANKLAGDLPSKKTYKVGPRS